MWSPQSRASQTLLCKHAGRLHDGVLLYMTIGPKHYQQLTNTIYIIYHGSHSHCQVQYNYVYIGCVHAGHMKAYYASKTDFMSHCY